jgi:hypothetical protein
MAFLPQDAQGMGPGEPGSGPGSSRPSPSGPEEPGKRAGEGADDTLAGEVVSLLDGVVDYLRAIFRLETYRIEARTRRIVRKALVLVLGAAVLLAGLVFVSVGVSNLLSEWLEASYAGPLIVGGVFLIAGLIAILAASRKQVD